MTLHPHRIAIVLPDLRGGGAERMHMMLARKWLVQGFHVDLVLLRQTGELLQLLPPGLSAIDLGVLRFRGALLPLSAYIRQQRPTVVLAAMWPLTVVALVAARLSRIGVRTVVSDHNTLSLAYSHMGPFHRLWLRASMALTYPLADVRVAVSKGVAVDLSKLSGIAPDRFRVIYNPAASVLAPASTVVSLEPLNSIRGPMILAVGTLKAQKDHRTLIRAFSQLAQEIDATLCILGEGASRSALERLVTELELSGRVLLPGFQVDTSPWYRRADLFVLSSKYEGFGNVIVEALEHGVPVISTDCPSGPREILCDGKYGRLVPVGDAAALAGAIRAALAEKPDREALKTRARDFSVDKIAAEYLEIMLPGWRDASNR